MQKETSSPIMMEHNNLNTSIKNNKRGLTLHNVVEYQSVVKQCLI